MASIVGVSASVGKFQLVGEVILKFKGKSPIKCVEIRAKEIHQKLCDVQKLFIETIQPDEQKDRNYLTVGISYILSKSSYVPKESGRTVIYTNFQVPGCSLLSADDFVEGGRQNQGNYSGSEFIRRVEERTKRGLETKKDSKSELRSDAAAHTEQAIYEYIEQNPDYFVKQLLSCLGTLEKVKVYALILHMHSSWQMCGNCEGALIDLQANAALRARIASAFQEKGLATPKNKSLPIHVIFSQTGKYPPKGRALPVELNCAKAIGSIPTFWIKESPSALKASIARFTTFKSARNQGTISEVDNLGMAYQSHTTSAPHAAFEREASGRKRKREEDKKGDHPEKRLRLEALIQFPEVSRYKDQDGKTYPHQAALLGDAEMLESFVESPADISARDQFGFTPFHYLGMGSAKKSEAMIDLLKKGGADIGADSVIGKPVEVAAAAFRARVLYRLSTEQENQERENLKEEMLKLAQEYLDISNTYLFASYRPGSDLSYYQDECACTETLNRISSAMRSTLVEQGENFSVVKDFIIACFYYFLSSVDEPAKSLVEKWVASSPRHHEMASYLLFEAANCDSPPQRSLSKKKLPKPTFDKLVTLSEKYLDTWIKYKQLPPLRLQLDELGEKWEDLEKKNEALERRIWQCLPQNYFQLNDLISLLDQHGASSSKINRCLHEAIERGDLQSVDRCCRLGIDLNEEGPWGFTPILRALYHGQNNILSLLLSNGADANLGPSQRKDVKDWIIPKKYLDPSQIECIVLKPLDFAAYMQAKDDDTGIKRLVEFGGEPTPLTSDDTVEYEKHSYIFTCLIEYISDNLDLISIFADLPQMMEDHYRALFPKHLQSEEFHSLIARLSSVQATPPPADWASARAQAILISKDSPQCSSIERLLHFQKHFLVKFPSCQPFQFNIEQTPRLDNGEEVMRRVRSLHSLPENSQECEELIQLFKITLEGEALLDRVEREELFEKLLALVEHSRKLD